MELLGGSEAGSGETHFFPLPGEYVRSTNAGPPHEQPSLNPLFMAFAAGAMVFISVHELLPMARRYHKTRLFVLGALISVFVYALLAALVPG